jgi:hypothetical protein
MATEAGDEAFVGHAGATRSVTSAGDAKPP